MKSYHYRRSSNSNASTSGPGLFASLSQLSKGFGGTAGLVVAMLILNFGVIQYHGDPRVLFGLVGGESAEAAEEQTAKPRVSPSEEPSSPTPSKPRVEELKAKSEPSKTGTTAPSAQKAVSDEPSGVRVKAGKKSLTDALLSLSDTYRFSDTLPLSERHREVETFRLKRNEMPSDALLARGFEREEIGRAFAAIAEHVDFRRLSPRCNFSTCRAGNRLVELEISCSRIERSRAILEANGQWRGQK